MIVQIGHLDESQQADYIGFFNRHPFATDAYELGYSIGIRELVYPVFIDDENASPNDTGETGLHLDNRYLGDVIVELAATIIGWLVAVAFVLHLFSHRLMAKYSVLMMNFSLKLVLIVAGVVSVPHKAG